MTDTDRECAASAEDQCRDAVERLVERMRVAYGGELGRDCAETLRALLAAKKAAEAERDQLRLACRIERWAKEAEEAKLAVAVETLGAIASCQSYVEGDCPSLARAALAQTKPKEGTENGS